MKDAVIDAASAASAAVKGQATSAVGGITAFVAGLSVNDFAALGGLLVGVAGFGVTWYYRRAEFKLTEAALLKRQADKHPAAAEPPPA